MNALIVADDYTGAMDTGHGFAARGHSVRVQLAGPEPGEYESMTPLINSLSETDFDVLSVDMNTRDASAKTARKAVSGLLNDEISAVYKKIDSTLRGNVVAEVDGATDAMGADLALVAPAFPSTGRKTVDGVHFVNGVPLAEAGYGASTSDLETVFEPSRYPVTALGTETVTRGVDAVRSALADTLRSEPVVVTCDATTTHDLETLASAADSLEATVLFVGSGGLATGFPLPETTATRELSETTSPAGHATGGALGVVGSVNERTLEQLRAVPDRLVYRLDPSGAVREPVRAGREAATALTDRLQSDGQAVVTGATEQADIERARSAAGDLSSDIDAGDQIVTALAAAAAETVELAPPSGLVCTGGSVARGVLESLSVTAIDLTGESVGDGIPEGRIVDGTAAGTRLVTKAGGFGAEGSIVNCLNFVGDGNDGN